MFNWTIHTRTAGLALLATGCLLLPAAAQGLDSEQAIDTIIGSEVDQQETQSIAATGDVLAAIDRTRETMARIRKTSALDTVDIVFLSDAAATEGGPPAEIEAKIEAHSDEIAELRKEFEGNAMLYHAADSRDVLMRDIIAVEFKDDRHVIVYAAAKPPS